MTSDVLIDATSEVMFVDKHIEVEFSIVRQQKQDSRDQELVITIVDVMAAHSMRSIAKIDENLSRRLIEQERIR